MFVDFDDINLNDQAAVDVQIAERHALIDRTYGELERLEAARVTQSGPTDRHHR